MHQFSRRSFIKSTTAASTGLLFIPDFLKNAPTNRLNVAVIGVGGRGKANWSKVPKENIVALCDVDDNRAASGFKMFPKAKKFKEIILDYNQYDWGINENFYVAASEALKLKKINLFKYCNVMIW